MNDNIKEIYLAGGCFWGTEHYFKKIEGVVFTEVGYANSIIEKPSYEDVCSGKTMAAEAVYIKYDSSVIGLDMLLNMYFVSIDPTSINKQGHDVGLQYRTGIYYTDKDDLYIINEVILKQQERYEDEIVVEVMPLENFYVAEDYHQDYLDKNPNGYCHLPLELFEYASKMSFKKNI
ncbi:MAG: peptide-methionine (S)-S-oxide reductase MsrA [Paludibacteraceae bacterium]|nr:peptide-methionine (S)-S-oxide reductase MsrA [Paludibacteraceae bacterium]